jgi:hypothetical protein
MSLSKRHQTNRAAIPKINPSAPATATAGRS